MEMKIVRIGQKIDFSAKNRRNQEDEKKLGLMRALRRGAFADERAEVRVSCC